MAVDEPLLRLWRDAHTKSIEDLRADVHPDLAGTLAEALACLAEAGLLDRIPACPESSLFFNRSADTIASRPQLSSVCQVNSSGSRNAFAPSPCSIIRSTMSWLSTTHRTCDIGPWLTERGLRARVVRLTEQTTFAGALNAGVEAGAPSEFIFLLNTDVSIHSAAVQNLIARAIKDPRCASVAPKLILWRTPAFLNGLGNRVPNVAWGVDNGIGQLDLGQLDHWTHVPSSCFGAVMITRAAWDDVGPCDPDYPGYYEDTDWTIVAGAWLSACRRC